MELVLVGSPAAVRRAQSMLVSNGIRARRSAAKKSEASLRVATSDARKARDILGSTELPDGRVIEEPEDAWFRCPGCGHNLSEGDRTCPSCGVFVG